MRLPDFDPASIETEQIPATLAMIAAWQSQLVARLMAVPAEQPKPADDDDELLTANEVAAILRRSAKWIYRRAAKLPFARRLDNRSWVFSKKGLDKWLGRQKA